MDTELLKTFLEVDKAGHFGRAAENLHVTPAAVSARVRQLEDLLGQPLFLRERRHIVLTPAGERLKPLACEMLATWGRVLQDVALANGDGAKFALGATANLWDCLLEDVLLAWGPEVPAMRLQAVCHDSSSLLAQLQRGQLDLAVLFDPVHLDGIARDHLGDLDMVLASSAPDQSLEQALAQHYVQVDWGISFATRHTRLLGGAVRAPALIAGTGRTGLAWVLARGGALYLPRHQARCRFRARQLFPVAEAPVISQPVYLACIGERVRGGAVQDAVQALAGAVRTCLSGDAPA